MYDLYWQLPICQNISSSCLYRIYAQGYFFLLVTLWSSLIKFPLIFHLVSHIPKMLIISFFLSWFYIFYFSKLVQCPNTLSWFWSYLCCAELLDNGRTTPVAHVFPSCYYLIFVSCELLWLFLEWVVEVFILYYQDFYKDITSTLAVCWHLEFICHLKKLFFFPAGSLTTHLNYTEVRWGR